MLGLARQRILAHSVRKLFPASPALLRSQFSAAQEDHYHSRNENEPPKLDIRGVQRHPIGTNVPRKDKVKFLVTTLLDLKDSKEAVYGALDAWVAWENNFPVASLRKAITDMEKQQQWHRAIQVIKWMLSKGQGTTMGTYQQLCRALDKDNRADEAHEFWEKKIGSDLHSVPWSFCSLMICVYYRNNMLEKLVKLFKGLESFNRKPPDKKIVQKVANAYELLGHLEEKDRVLDKYKDLFTVKEKSSRKSKNSSSKKDRNSGQKRHESTQKDAIDDTDRRKCLDC